MHQWLLYYIISSRRLEFVKSYYIAHSRAAKFPLKWLSKVISFPSLLMHYLQAIGLSYTKLISLIIAADLPKHPISHSHTFLTFTLFIRRVYRSFIMNKDGRVRVDLITGRHPGISLIYVSMKRRAKDRTAVIVRQWFARARVNA